LGVVDVPPNANRYSSTTWSRSLPGGDSTRLEMLSSRGQNCSIAPAELEGVALRRAVAAERAQAGGGEERLLRAAVDGHVTLPLREEGVTRDRSAQFPCRVLEQAVDLAGRAAELPRVGEARPDDAAHVELRRDDHEGQFVFDRLVRQGEVVGRLVVVVAELAPAPGQAAGLEPDARAAVGRGGDGIELEARVEEALWRVEADDDRPRGAAQRLPGDVHGAEADELAVGAGDQVDPRRAAGDGLRRGHP
jgi:hypothetical protein